MIPRAPRLPFVLNPLIAEARERARRRSVLFATGLGMFVAGGGAAAAGFFASQHYHQAARYTGPMIVLVANGQIEKGTPANAVFRGGGRYAVVTIRPSQVLPGAFGDPSELAGKVALSDIPPGAQLTAANFGSSNP